MQTRVPKSIVFGAERAEKSLYKRKIPCGIFLGPSGRRFEPCRLDQIDKFLLNLVDFSFYLIKTLYVQFLPFKKASKKEGRHAT